MILPCVILAVQADDPIALHLRSKAHGSGIDCRTGEAGAGSQLFLLHLDIEIIAIGLQADGISHIQAIGGGNGLGDHAHPASVGAFAFRKVSTGYNSCLFSGEDDLVTQLVHCKYREAMLAEEPDIIVEDEGWSEVRLWPSGEQTEVCP